MSDSNLESVNQLVYGSPNRPLAGIEVTAGAMTAIIEPETGQLRYVRVHGVEVIRGIYATVRDENWGTIVPVIENLTYSTNGDGFECTFGATHKRDNIHYAWVGTIRGHKEGWITYQFEGAALSEFLSNRTGICILHPSSLAGKACEVFHQDGAKENSMFPELITPSLPFENEVAISHSPVEGMTFTAEYSGAKFSTEDQRNWTDASYKTYLRMPGDVQPYPLKNGERFSQKVRLSVSGAGSPSEAKHELLSLKLPGLGTLVDSPLTVSQISQLKSLGVSHLMATPEALAEAQKVGAPVFLLTSDPASAGPLSADDAVILYPPSKSKELEAIKGPHRFVGSGNDFTELNSQRSLTKVESDGVAFPMNAQVHAFDSRTIQESGWIHGTCVKTAKSFSEGKIIAGPIRLKPRGTDPRTSSLVAIGFMLASIRTLAESGANYATYFTASELLSSPATLIFDLLRAGTLVPGIRGVEPFWVALQSKFDPEGASHASHRMLIANQLPETQLIDVGTVAPGAVMQILDSSNVSQWKRLHNSPAIPVGSKFSLGPNAFAVIHWTE